MVCEETSRKWATALFDFHDRQCWGKIIAILDPEWNTITKFDMLEKQARRISDMDICGELYLFFKKWDVDNDAGFAKILFALQQLNLNKTEFLRKMCNIPHPTTPTSTVAPTVIQTTPVASTVSQTTVAPTPKKVLDKWEVSFTNDETLQGMIDTLKEYSKTYDLSATSMQSVFYQAKALNFTYLEHVCFSMMSMTNEEESIRRFISIWDEKACKVDTRHKQTTVQNIKYLCHKCKLDRKIPIVAYMADHWGCRYATLQFFLDVLMEY